MIRLRHTDGRLAHFRSARALSYSYRFASCPTPDDANIAASLAAVGSFPHPRRPPLPPGGPFPHPGTQHEAVAAQCESSSLVLVN